MLSHPPLWLILVAFICALGPIVFFHELGHYLVARMFRVPAEVFSIGFGREIAGWTDRQGTRWKVGWLPLGGYVKFVGDMIPASDPADAESIPPELRDRAFQVRPVWQRFLIVLAGPMANFLLAIIIFAAFFAFIGTPQTNVVGSIKAGSPAAAAGIQPGDRIVAVAGVETSTFGEIANLVAVRPDRTVAVTIERDEAISDIRVHLGTVELSDPTGTKFRGGILGVYSTNNVQEPVSIFKAVPMAVQYTANLTRLMVDGIIQLVAGHISAKQIGGPIKIAQVAGEGAAQGPLAFAGLLALLSINLGFINLLPVLPLDGGHLFFYVVEAVRRRPVGPRALDWVVRGGLGLILFLMLFATGNDLGLWDRLQRLIG
ncbi:MAG TPA: RIP metalloprotease [Sphingomicrobium sp.]|jgi:regulator of sigma E protease|nr:RIP metalloprotease [Sphingomicrobium sp.]